MNKPMNTYFERSALSRIPVNCLLVDDLQENLLALSALLRQDGVNLLLARSGDEALNLLLMHEVALAIVDVQMPVMDGFELAELMRGSERTRRIPLIFVTAGARDERRLFAGYEAGAVDFLYKPIESHVLISKTNVFFQLYRQQQQLAYELRERSETLRLNEMFMAILGHDLRNPLQSIILSAQVLQQTQDEAQVKAMADRLLASGQWMDRLVDDMLDLARSRLGGGIGIIRQRMNLENVIDRQLSEFRISFPQRTIRHSKKGGCLGVWDENRLAQVSSNLIGNALQHSAEDTVIDVNLDGTAPDQVKLEVISVGSIATELLPHLFDPFRGGERLPTHKGGLGLGLYIVRQIIDAHNGSITVQSENGHTSFSVKIPR